jgi:hypothetical protein
MRTAALVDGHHWLTFDAYAYLRQAAAFFAPTVFKFDNVSVLHGILRHHHPDVLLSVNARANLRFLHGHKKILTLMILKRPSIRFFSDMSAR